MVYAVAVLLISSLTTVGLIAVWAATSPGNWFWRTMAFLGAMSPLLLIPAYEPFVAFVIQGTVVVAGVQLARWRQARKSGEPFFKSRFSLKSVLLAMVPAAVLVAAGVQLIEAKELNWIGSAQTGIAAGATSLMGLWIATGRISLGWRVIAGVAAAMGLTALLRWNEWFVSEVVTFDFEYASGRTDWEYIRSIPYWKDAAVTTVWLAIVSLSLLYIAIICTLIKVPRTAGNSRHRLALLLCLLIASPSTTALALLVKKPQIPQAEVPNPNGYDDFLAAAQLLPPRVTVTSANFDPDNDPLDVVRKAIAEVQPSIDLMRASLGKGFCQPLNYSTTDDITGNDAARKDDAFRKIGYGFLTVGKLAEREGDYVVAADEYLTLVEFAAKYPQGGTVIHLLGRSTWLGMGCEHLYNIRNSIPVQHQRKVGTLLAVIEESIEPYKDLIERDGIWSIHVLGWKEHLRRVLKQFVGGDWFDMILASVHGRELATLRLLQLELALRLYAHDHGRHPESLDALAPKYIEAVPIDPMSREEGPMRFAKTRPASCRTALARMVSMTRARRIPTIGISATCGWMCFTRRNPPPTSSLAPLHPMVTKPIPIQSETDSLTRQSPRKAPFTSRPSMIFRSYTNQFDAQTLAWARLVHSKMFGGLPLEWHRHNTSIEAWHGTRRVAFAPHKSAAPLYFQGTTAVNQYRRWGGALRTGKVAIKIPLGADFEAALLRQVVVEYLGIDPV